MRLSQAQKSLQLFRAVVPVRHVEESPAPPAALNVVHPALVHREERQEDGYAPVEGVLTQQPKQPMQGLMARLDASKKRASCPPRRDQSARPITAPSVRSFFSS